MSSMPMARLTNVRKVPRAVAMPWRSEDVEGFHDINIYSKIVLRTSICSSDTGIPFQSLLLHTRLYAPNGL